jgi:hypothetical protein
MAMDLKHALYVLTTKFIRECQRADSLCRSYECTHMTDWIWTGQLGQQLAELPQGLMPASLNESCMKHVDQAHRITTSAARPPPPTTTTTIQPPTVACPHVACNARSLSFSQSVCRLGVMSLRNSSKLQCKWCTLFGHSSHRHSSATGSGRRLSGSATLAGSLPGLYPIY